MTNTIMASEDGCTLGVFEGETEHLLLFKYIPSMDMIEIKIMDGGRTEARFTLAAHDNQNGRKHEGIIAIEHYMTRIRQLIEGEDFKKVS